MSIFKRKSTKAKQEAEAKEKQQQASDQPPKEKYKHIPRHAAADSAITGRNVDPETDRQRISMANQRRMSRGRDMLPTPNPVYAHSMHGGTPPVPSIRSGMSRHTMSSPALFTQDGQMSRTDYNRTASDFFVNRNTPQAPSFDSPMLGNPKMAMAARDRGYINPHYSADSGYGSAGPSSAVHSRAPSEQAFYSEAASQTVPRSTGGYLPELTLGEELNKDGAISEQSFKATEDENVSLKKISGTTLKHSNRPSSSHRLAESPSDNRSIKSTRSGKSTPKQIRFEKPQDAVPPVPVQYQQNYSSYSEPLEHSEQASEVQEYSAPVSPTLTRDSRELKSPTLRTARFSNSPNPYAPRSSSRRASLPPLSILSGLKVNKKGNLLDEEGDPVGELYEGELIDCIRLKADEEGHVLDEYGSVVGRVRTIMREQDVSPVLSPTLGPTQPNIQENQYEKTHERRISAISPHEASHEQSFYSQQTQSPDNRDGESVPQIYAPRAVRPIDLDSDVQHIELDATKHSQAPPIVDHSDIFVPPFRRHSPSQASSEQSESSAAQDEPAQRPTSSRTPTIQIPQGNIQPSVASPTSPNYPDSKSRRIPLIRSSSEGSISDMSSKSYARPTMDSVPEDSNVPTEVFNPAMFSYKGEIPPGPGPSSVRATSPKAPKLSPAMNMALLTPSGIPPAINSQHLGGTGVPRKAQFSAGVPGVRPGMNSRHSSNQPIRRSPLSSHENSPPESEESTSDDGKLNAYLHQQPTMPRPLPMHTRTASVRTTHSVRSTTSIGTNGKPRMYFTHSGRVAASDLPPPLPIPADGDTKGKKESTPSITDKKKSRFSFRFGKKNSQALSAH